MKKILTALFLLFLGVALKAQTPNPKVWTKRYEAIVSMAIYNSPVLKSSNNKTRRYYCDCYVKGLKATYPEGIHKNVPYSVQNRIKKSCLELIKINASSLKNSNGVKSCSNSYVITLERKCGCSGVLSKKLIANFDFCNLINIFAYQTNG